MATAVRKPRTSGGGGLTKKLGPLPLWAWVAIGAAGILAGVYLKRRLASSTQQSASSATTPDTSTVGTTYPDLGGATSGGAAGSGIAPNEFSDFSALLGTLESAGLLGGQAAPPAQTGTAPISIATPAITLPAPVVTYVTRPASTSGAKVTTGGNGGGPAQTVSPIVEPSYPAITFTAPGPTPAGTPLPAAAFVTPGTPAGAGNPYGSYPQLNLNAPLTSQPAHATTVAIQAARPGGVSANKQQGVYSIH